MSPGTPRYNRQGPIRRCRNRSEFQSRLEMTGNERNLLFPLLAQISTRSPPTSPPTWKAERDMFGVLVYSRTLGGGRHNFKSHVTRFHPEPKVSIRQWVGTNSRSSPPTLQRTRLVPTQTPSFWTRGPERIDPSPFFPPKGVVVDH